MLSIKKLIVAIEMLLLSLSFLFSQTAFSVKDTLKWETLTSYFTVSDTFYQDNSFSIGSDRDRVYYSVCAVDYCSNYSNYTSSVMYQGTSPLWKAAFIDQDTIIYSNPDIDGNVLGDVFESNNHWTVTDWEHMICGDFEDDMSVGVSYRSYLSFDISFIENSDVITDAKLIVYQFYSIGNFVEGRYPILKLDGDTSYPPGEVHLFFGKLLS